MGESGDVKTHRNMFPHGNMDCVMVQKTVIFSAMLLLGNICKLQVNIYLQL